jgi:hypothetical protein
VGPYCSQLRLFPRNKAELFECSVIRASRRRKNPSLRFVPTSFLTDRDFRNAPRVNPKKCPCPLWLVTHDIADDIRSYHDSVHLRRLATAVRRGRTVSRLLIDRS